MNERHFDMALSSVMLNSPELLSQISWLREIKNQPVPAARSCCGGGPRARSAQESFNKVIEGLAAATADEIALIKKTLGVDQLRLFRSGHSAPIII